MSKMRSPNYPAIGLREAIESTHQLWSREKRTAVDLGSIATAWGYASISGRVRSKIGALRKYGLLEDAGDGTRISELGMRIVHGLPDSDDYKTALREAALSPELFKELYENYRSASDQAIKSYLIVKKQFADIGAGEVIKAFRETVEVANLDSDSYTPPNERVVEGGTMTLATVPSIGFRPDMVPMPASVPLPGSGGQWTWTLSIPRSVSAELRIAGEVTKYDLARLRKQIEFLEESFNDEAES